MSRNWQRRGADLACRVAVRLLPQRLRTWGLAVRQEAAAVPDDREALRFALAGIRGLVGCAMADVLDFAGERVAMTIDRNALQSPRVVGVVCAIGAVMLGLAYLQMAGAPTRYLAINGAALALGLVLAAMMALFVPTHGRGAGAAVLTMALGLLVTALIGDQVDGAARWVKLGPLAVQPSLIVLPWMILSFARERSAMGLAGMIAAAAAMAIQPDRAMAGMLVAGLAGLVAMRRDRAGFVALIASVAAFGVTLVRGDTLPPAPFVDRILISAFDVHAAAGLAVVGGSALLVVPALVQWRGNREVQSAFAGVWLAVIAAAALGNYPTPLVGFGGSAILGYLLSLSLLSTRSSAIPAAGAAIGAAGEVPEPEGALCIATA